MTLVDTTTGEIVPSVSRALDSASDPIGFVLACCDQARMALLDAQSVTEGKNLLGALSTLEHAVKVRDLNAEAVTAASAMRVRAERRVGELIKAERDTGRLANKTTGRPRLRPVESLGRPETYSEGPATLSDLGISHDQAAEFTRLADADEETFEAAIAGEVERSTTKGGLSVTRSGVLRAVNPEREKRHDERWADGDKFTNACQRITALADDAVTAIRFGIFPGDLPLVGDGVRRAVSEAATSITRVDRELERTKK